MVILIMCVVGRAAQIFELCSAVEIDNIKPKQNREHAKKNRRWLSLGFRNDEIAFCKM